MKIALLGYGKMGKEIEKIAISRNHQICCTIDNSDEWESKKELLKEASVAIEFSTPKTVVNNILNCFKYNIPLVVGTTGWDDSFDKIIQQCKESGNSIFHASNFSIGMNIFFEINKKLANLMKGHTNYKVSMEETHHIHKLDAPSGTAVSLANQILEQNQDVSKWYLKDQETSGDFPIQSNRIGEIPGTHSISWDSEIDHITITHKAKNRKGFALGAVFAAEFIEKKKGVYAMNDLLF